MRGRNLGGGDVCIWEVYSHTLFGFFAGRERERERVRNRVSLHSEETLVLDEDSKGMQKRTGYDLSSCFSAERFTTRGAYIGTYIRLSPISFKPSQSTSRYRVPFLSLSPGSITVMHATSQPPPASLRNPPRIQKQNLQTPCPHSIHLFPPSLTSFFSHWQHQKITCRVGVRSVGGEG